MLEAVGTCLPISPRKKRLFKDHLHHIPSKATPLKPHVERLLEQSNDVEANPGPLPHRLLRAHSGSAQVRESRREGGFRQRLMEKHQEEGRSREQEMDQATLPPRPHVPRLLEQANDVECNPGPLPHRLVTRAPPTSNAQQARGRVQLSILSQSASS